MTHPTRYSELVERLEKAEGADREIDGTIHRLSHGSVLGRWPAYTASLDAALALVGEKLPKGGVSITGRLTGPYSAMLTTGTGAELTDGRAPTAPAAVLIALLRALEGE